MERNRLHVSLFYFILIESILCSIGALKFNLTSGIFEAAQIKFNNSEVFKLLKIPFAEIPLTFEKPVTKNRSYFNDTKYRETDGLKRCIGDAYIHAYGNFQLPKNTYATFDCLTINIYIPNSKTYESGNLSVMLFLHGGSNAIGSSSYFDASAIASFGDVMVAIPNYRLSVLGFFNSKENNISGNYGLWDQLLALEWLYQNCENLGCNKTSITIFGQSAGAADAMLLGMSTKAQKYINRLILQSGSALSHWAMDHDSDQTDESNRKLRNLALNYISYITCETSLKYQCIKSKIQRFLNQTRNDTTETKLEAILKNVIKNTNSLQFTIFLNKIFFIHTYYNKKSKYWYLNTTNEELEYTNIFGLGYMELSSTDYEACKKSFLFSNKNIIDDKLRILFCSSINNLTGISTKNGELLTRISEFLACFYEPYKLNETSLNYRIIIDELKQCADYSIELNSTDRSQFDLVHSLADELTYLYDDMTCFYKPVVDDDLVKQNPYKLLMNENFNKIDIMIGVNQHESFYVIDNGHKFTDIVKNVYEQAKLLYPSESNINEIVLTKSKKNCLKMVLRKFYSNFVKGAIKDKLNECYENETILSFENLNLLSDYDLKLSMSSILKSKYDQSHQQSNLYAYEFTYLSTFNDMLHDAINMSKTTYDAYNLYDKQIVPHNAEMDFVFGLPILNSFNHIINNTFLYNYTDIDYSMSVMMIKYWSNFAKYGNPNYGSDDSYTKWQPFTRENPSILMLDSTKPKLSDKLFDYYMAIHSFWYKNFTFYIENECNQTCSNANSVALATQPKKILLFFIFYFIYLFILK